VALLLRLQEGNAPTPVHASSQTLNIQMRIQLGVLAPNLQTIVADVKARHKRLGSSSLNWLSRKYAKSSLSLLWQNMMAMAALQTMLKQPSDLAIPGGTTESLACRTFGTTPIVQILA